MKSSSSTNHGLTDGKEYNLKIGTSFQPSKAQESYHVLRYDFKPASIDTSRPAELKIGSNNECKVTFPNVHDSGATTYKGGKKPCTKECVLIIDKKTGEITLERIASNIPLKKSRTGTIDRSGDIRKTGANPLLTNTKGSKGSSSNTTKESNKSSTSSSASSASTSQSSQAADTQQHGTPSSQPSSQPSKPSASQVQQQAKQTSKPVESKQSEMSTASSSDSSSSDSSDSDSDVEDHAAALNKFNEIATPYEAPSSVSQSQTTSETSSQPSGGARMPTSTLYSDLQLSDSNSDSD